MPNNLNNIKRRINSVNSTRKITNSMKLVSNVKSRRFSSEYLRQEEYAREIKEIISDCLKIANSKDLYETLPLLKINKEAKKRLVILVTSNLGLCGAYNTELFKFYNSVYKKDDDLIIIGEKGINEYSNKFGGLIIKEFRSIGEKFNIRKAKDFTTFLVDLYLKGEYKEVHIIYHKYINTLVSKVKMEQVLPFVSLEKIDTYSYEPLYEPSAEVVINFALNEELMSNIYSYLFSSLVSEHSARRNAMDNADKNAKELIEKLNLEYNKERQQSITQEITEVVAGSLNK